MTSRTPHSLYAEVLGELGIVGFALLVTVLLASLFALLPVGRGANRQLYAALFAMELAWVVHTGVDWDWQMPAVTVGAIALGGAALATHQSQARAILRPRSAGVVQPPSCCSSAVLPALVLLSQRDLNDAREALRADRCGESIRRASDSIKTLEIRPEPYELIALCQAHRGYTGFAIQAMRKASQRDPDNWRYHFELGVLLGGAGHNTRPELLRARQLNPQYADTKRLLEAAPAGEAVDWDLELIGAAGPRDRPAMTESLRIRELTVLAAVLGAGLAGTVVALGSRATDDQFLADQINPPNLRAVDVERVVQSAPDPQIGTGRGSGATCTAGSESPLGNPWSCVVHYKSGRSVRIRVRVLNDGTYRGRYADGGGATGCCIDLPGTDEAPPDRVERGLKELARGA